MSVTTLQTDASFTANLAHHFDSPQQQFEAAKLGMWLFLATEVLLFGGLFCLYAVFRGNRPELFAYGSRYLDTNWGAINTVVLITSSLTMAIAVYCAQTGQQRPLVIFLGLTFFFGLDFLGIKYIEYTHKFHDKLVWGVGLYEMPEFEALKQRLILAEEKVSPPLKPGNPERGRKLYLKTCLPCHGASGQGLPGLGKPLSTSQFVAGRSDRDLQAFLQVGRPIGDPANTSGVAMLPRGGNISLSDQDLMDIIASVRTLQTDGEQDAGATGEQAKFQVPKSVIAPAAVGPGGFRLPDETDQAGGEGDGRVDYVSPRLDESRPRDLHLFFSLYYCMTGLHGLHVLIGMIVIGWLLTRAFRGHFSAAYYTPVDLGGLYWHIVDIIWIFLFPMLYLIR